MDSPNIRHFTRMEALGIHSRIMQTTDDAEQVGVKYPDRLEAMLERPKTRLFGVEQFPTVLEKACCYYHSIATTHIFQNGNKRSAQLAFVAFLRRHGMNINLSTRGLTEYTVALTTEERYKTNDCIRIMVDELKPHVVTKEETRT